MSLDTIAALLLQYRYFVMVPLVFFMQPAVGVTGGILSRLGLMEVFAVYATVSLTALLGDIMWYWIGYHYGQSFVARFGRLVGLTADHVRAAQKIFHTHDAKILLISKVTNGFGLAIVVLFTAGMSRVRFGRYVFFNAIGEFAWSAIIVGVGYYLGDLYLSVQDVFGRFALGMLLLVLAFGIFRFMRYMGRRFESYAAGPE